VEGTGRELTSCRVRESSRRTPGERAHGGHRPGERAREENGKLLKILLCILIKCLRVISDVLSLEFIVNVEDNSGIHVDHSQLP
jgi:hypothetical protein